MLFILKRNSGHDGVHKFSVTYTGSSGRSNTIKFGNRSYEDFTQHRDENRKILYENRHKKNENWNDLTTAGAWSKNLLWNKHTITESIHDMQQKFKNITIRIDY